MGRLDLWTGLVSGRFTSLVKVCRIVEMSLRSMEKLSLGIRPPCPHCNPASQPSADGAPLGAQRPALILARMDMESGSSPNTPTRILILVSFLPELLIEITI